MHAREGAKQLQVRNMENYYAELSITFWKYRLSYGCFNSLIKILVNEWQSAWKFKHMVVPEGLLAGAT